MALAALPGATAGEIDFNTLPIPPEPFLTPAPDAATVPERNKQAEGASVGGAVFSPFVEASASPPRRPAPAATVAAESEAEASLALTAVTVLAGGFALVWLLRRI